MSKVKEGEKYIKKVRSRSRNPKDVAQEPLLVGSRERTLLPQTCPLQSRRWQQKTSLESLWVE